MNRKDVIKKLTELKPELIVNFGVTHLALFGSTARDIANHESDIDILVSFNGSATSARYFGVQFLLEDQFGCNIDLVTEKGLRPELRKFVEQDVIYV